MLVSLADIRPESSFDISATLRICDLESCNRALSPGHPSRALRDYSISSIYGLFGGMSPIVSP